LPADFLDLLSNPATEFTVRYRPI